MSVDLSRRAFLCAVAGCAAAATTGCGDASHTPFFRDNFREMSKEELDGVIADLEKSLTAAYRKPVTVGTQGPIPGVHFAYALDISRCVGCRRCVHACVKENNQSRDPQIQWIRVLEMDKDRGIDFEAANPYYGAEAAAANQALLRAQATAEVAAREAEAATGDASKAAAAESAARALLAADARAKAAETQPRPGHFYVPMACQQCENPPCVKSCPVGATWREEDGIVAIDYDWCIGCRCCVASCPYGARRFNWAEPGLPAGEMNPDTHYLGNRPRMKGVVEKCTFCIQRVRAGRYPACVEVCPVGARKFGNLLDPASEVRYVLEHKRVVVLKNELNTRPRFFYFFG
jgi:Fe-S-cluster-containing dehydrogenase component